MTAIARTDSGVVIVDCTPYGEGKLGCRIIRPRSHGGVAFLDGDAKRMLAGGTIEQLEARLAEDEVTLAPTQNAPRYLRILSRYRVKSRVSIMDAATQLGVSPATLSGYERGTEEPSAEFLERWIAMLGIPSEIVHDLRQRDQEAQR